MDATGDELDDSFDDERPSGGVDLPDDDGESLDPLGIARLRVRTIWLTLALLAVLAIGAVYGHGLVEDDLDERVSRALEREGFDDIDVGLAGREVTLTGSVDSPDDAGRAAETVRAVEGIKGITVELRIGEPSP